MPGQAQRVCTKKNKKVRIYSYSHLGKYSMVSVCFQVGVLIVLLSCSFLVCFQSVKGETNNPITRSLCRKPPSQNPPPSHPSRCFQVQKRRLDAHTLQNIRTPRHRLWNPLSKGPAITMRTMRMVVMTRVIVRVRAKARAVVKKMEMVKRKRMKMPTRLLSLRHPNPPYKSKCGQFIYIPNETGEYTKFSILERPQGKLKGLTTHMELDGRENKDLVKGIQSTVRSITLHVARNIKDCTYPKLAEEQRSFIMIQVSAFIQARNKYPYLARFRNNWVTKELIIRSLTNKRDHQARIKKAGGQAAWCDKLKAQREEKKLGKTNKSTGGRSDRSEPDPSEHANQAKGPSKVSNKARDLPRTPDDFQEADAPLRENNLTKRVAISLIAKRKSSQSQSHQVQSTRSLAGLRILKMRLVVTTNQLWLPNPLHRIAPSDLTKLIGTKASNKANHSRSRREWCQLNSDPNIGYVEASGRRQWGMYTIRQTAHSNIACQCSITPRRRFEFDLSQSQKRKPPLARSLPQPRNPPF
ncbi:hypothetical protein AG1IA_08381 [Rhizoctonia solani AG-1 IA]|uniref:Uncharacterized protein n=1 Tax=Thanatephorus cucumeris (strain AG1-IA) TaxID=983506 RepID=L8WML2_THACA|nr:hypothetical protein AG1IA_08381 [Rhizoctonia solani AG-1 IA]